MELRTRCTVATAQAANCPRPQHARQHARQPRHAPHWLPVPLSPTCWRSGATASRGRGCQHPPALRLHCTNLVLAHLHDSSSKSPPRERDGAPAAPRSLVHGHRLAQRRTKPPLPSAAAPDHSSTSWTQCSVTRYMDGGASRWPSWRVTPACRTLCRQLRPPARGCAPCWLAQTAWYACLGHLGTASPSQGTITCLCTLAWPRCFPRAHGDVHTARAGACTSHNAAPASPLRKQAWGKDHETTLLKSHKLII